MKNITNTKEAEKRTTEEHDFADCRVHTPVELTTGGCSSSIELTEETSCIHFSIVPRFFSL